MQDNVFITVLASVQYRAWASDAFYKLTDTRTQMQAYVFDGMTGSEGFKRINFIFIV